MTQKKVKLIHQFYRWILASLIVLLGVLFILSCLDIYHSGPRPYSAEAIAFQFSRICIPVYITLALVVGGIALNMFLPLEGNRPRSPKRDAAVLQRLRIKVGTPAAPQSQMIQKEMRLRMILRIVTAVVFTGIMIYPCFYFMDLAHFSVSNLNGDIVKAVVISMIPATIGLVLCLICQLLCTASMRREIQQYKQLAASGVKQANVAPLHSDKKQLHIRRLIQGGLLAVAAVMIVSGIINGGADDVLKKAIAICTECIGLG